jgi:rhomboid protease GluP
METRRMCPHCRAFITTKDKICPYCETRVGPSARDRLGADLVAGIIPTAQFATIVILTLNVGMYLLTSLASMRSGGGGLMGLDGRTLLQFGASFPPYIFGAGQWWRLLTAGFLHGGLMHILFNSWALMDVGSHAEQIYGTPRMSAIYLLSTMGGFGASAVFTGSLSVGASAGLLGLIGAMIAYGMAHHGPEASMVKQFYVRWLIYILLMGLLPFFHIDNAAHIGGLAVGFAVGWLAGTPDYDGSFRDRLWKTVAGIMVAVTALAFVKMFLFVYAVSRVGN